MDRGACFAALGIDEDASYDEAHDAFRRLACATHPDLGGDALRFAAVHAAWRTLSPTLVRRPRPVATTAPAPLHQATAASAPAPTVAPAAPTTTPAADPFVRRAQASYASSASLPRTRPLATRRHRPVARPVAPVDPAFADLLSAALSAA
jgi:hypothetical protein